MITNQASSLGGRLMPSICKSIVKLFSNGTDGYCKEQSDEDLIKALSVLKKADFREVQRLGYHFQRNDFYSPLNDCDFLDNNSDLWKTSRQVACVNWNLDGQLETAAMVGEFVDELRDVPDQCSTGNMQYCWDNGFWNNADALVQYGLLRAIKPRRVVEIGCGWSSLLMQRALDRNGSRCVVTQVEPYPNRKIFELLPTEWTHHECILQRAPLSVFEQLQAGDICFYDGSHCSKVGSDVNWFFFEILPRLAPGVIIHLHDIFLPDAYPAQWIFERGQTWNEQYILQAFLMNNNDYEVMIANRYLYNENKELLDSLFKGVQPSYGCSFWMKKLK